MENIFQMKINTQPNKQKLITASAVNTFQTRRANKNVSLVFLELKFLVHRLKEPKIMYVL